MLSSLLARTKFGNRPTRSGNTKISNSNHHHMVVQGGNLLVVDLLLENFGITTPRRPITKLCATRCGVTISNTRVIGQLFDPNLCCRITLSLK